MYIEMLIIAIIIIYIFIVNGKISKDNIFIRIIVHAIVIINSWFLLSGEKYYNENVGAE